MHGLNHEHTRRPARRASTMALVAGVSFGVLASAVHAQRPAPPKGWIIDTTGDRPSAARSGGMMSTDSRVEILGPMAWTGASATDWLQKFARDNAGNVGVLVPSKNDAVSVTTIAGQQLAVAAYSVKESAQTLYFSYSMSAATAPGAPAIVIRSTFRDALTMVRAFRSSVEAVLPYVLAPTPQMRALAVAAAPQPVPTSFHTTAPIAETNAAGGPRRDSTTADTAATSAVRAGVDDAIALLGADTTKSNRPRSASTSPPRQAGSRPTPATAATGTATASDANVAQVVFYQWGDLQYHPVALFTDGSSFDIDEGALDALDVARSKAEFPGKWGRWRHTGAQYVLTDGRTARESNWTLGSGFHPAFPAPIAGTLNGRYKSVSGSTMGETSTLLTSTLRFLPDGRFTGGSDFAAVGSGEVSGVTMAAGASKATTGRYKISRYHIQLIRDDGRTTTHFFGFGSSGAKAVLDREMIFIGSTAYVLEAP